MKIAVLIPIYNGARYLRQCLDSVLSQTGVELEVFCRDDGSVDGTWELLSEFAARHANVHVVRQENAGVSVTRNRLMDDVSESCGALAFVDADDTIAPGMYAKLHEALVRTESDIAECEWDGAERVIDDMSVYLLRRTAPGAWINVWNKLYRRSALGSLRFRDGLRFEEDLFFNLEVHAAARRKVLVPGRFYAYRDNPDSATRALDFRHYFESTARRIRLSLEVFLEAGRIPAAQADAFRKELSRDAFRMCLRKNLRKNPDAAERRELFGKAGVFFRECEGRGFSAIGLSPVPRAILACCKAGKYGLARGLVYLT